MAGGHTGPCGLQGKGSSATPMPCKRVHRRWPGTQGGPGAKLPDCHRGVPKSAGTHCLPDAPGFRVGDISTVHAPSCLAPTPPGLPPNSKHRVHCPVLKPPLQKADGPQPTGATALPSVRQHWPWEGATRTSQLDGRFLFHLSAERSLGSPAERPGA